MIANCVPPWTWALPANASPTRVKYGPNTSRRSTTDTHALFSRKDISGLRQFVCQVFLTRMLCRDAARCQVSLTQTISLLREELTPVFFTGGPGGQETLRVGGSGY